MAIKVLPDYMINRLKAGEVVERPASVIKELVENSLDAGAKNIVVSVKDGGKNMIMVEDDGDGIEIIDMDNVITRYATSKMSENFDLQDINYYGFRGEALASISEVSKITIQSKTAYSNVAVQLKKSGSDIDHRSVAVSFDHGTTVIVEDLFYNVPARQKFMRSAQTEYFYCYNYMLDVALCRPDVYIVFKKNDNIVFNLKPVDNMVDRVGHVFKKDRSKNLKILDFQDGDIKISGVVGDAGLSFASTDNIKIFVNKRPVNDRMIKKAIMDAYKRQMHPGEYPLAFVFIDIDNKLLDVNVHPRKMEVKFMDPKKIFSCVISQISGVLGSSKVVSMDHVISDMNKGYNNSYASNNSFDFAKYAQSSVGNKENYNFDDIIDEIQSNDVLGGFKIIGQLWDMYIVLQSEDAIYYIDQHAMAERIAFEKLKKSSNEKGFVSQALLSPISLDLADRGDLDDKIKLLCKLGFDLDMLGENKIAIYAVPNILLENKIDIEKLMNYVLSMEGDINLDHFLDNIFASRACKASIKAGEKLNYLQMENLVREGFSNIEGMFVCQHGRPFFVKIDRSSIDKMVDR